MQAPSYAAAGVDIAAADENVRRIASHVRSTHGPAVLGDFGAFGGLFHLTGLHDPVLVASTDGVGSKLQVGIEIGEHALLGRDLVNLSVNDVLTTGARPLFFLDYVAVHKLDHAVVEQLIAGMAASCRENSCALLGGETAQLPDLYAEDRYDLAGFVVGVVEREALIDGSRVRAGDRVWGLPSTGLHTNGYSLARAILAQAGLGLTDHVAGLDETLGAALLQPHPSYLKALTPLLEIGVVGAIAHITGGGLPGNLPRVLPPDLSVALQWGSWPVPPIFPVLQRLGGITEDEMLRVFNMGLGIVFVCGDGVDVPRMCPDALAIGQVTAAGDERVVIHGG